MADHGDQLAAAMRDRSLEVIVGTPKWQAAMYRALTDPTWLDEVEWHGSSAMKNDPTELVDRFLAITPGRDNSYHIATVEHALRQIDQADLTGKDAEKLEQAAGQFYLLGLLTCSPQAVPIRSSEGSAIQENRGHEEEQVH